MLSLRFRLTAASVLMCLAGPLIAVAHPAAAATTLDPSYGVAGVGTFDIAPAMPGTGLVHVFQAVADPSGREVLATKRDVDNRVVLLRLTANGAVDTSFGNRGAQVLPTGFSMFRLEATSIGIVVSGYRLHSVTTGPPWFATVIRLLPDGSFDNTFGTAGVVELLHGANQPIYAIDIDLAPNGSVTTAVLGQATNDTSYDLYRLRTDGTTDPAFGTAGIVHVASVSEPSASEAFTVDASGRTIVAKTMNPDTTTATTSLLRLRTDGTIDPTFGTAGAASLGTGAVDLLAVSGTDGSIVAGGSRGPINNSTSPMLWHLTSSGALDTRFGNNGSLAMDPGSASGYLEAVVPLPTGHLAVLGTNRTTGVITMLRPDGSSEPGFGSNGQLAFGQSPVFGGLNVGTQGRLLLTTAAPAGSTTQQTFSTQALLTSLQSVAPTITAVTARQGALTITWTPPAAPTGGPVRAYYVVATNGTTIVSGQVVAGDVRHTSLNGLTNGTTYQAVVVPYSSSGSGIASAAVPGTPSAGAPAPAASGPALGVTASSGNGFATINWTPPADDGGAPISTYSIIAVNHTTGALAAWRNLPADVRTAAIPDLTNSTSYDLYVVAATSAGFGQLAPALHIVPLSTGAAALAPTIPWASAVATGTNAIVTWGPPTEQGQTATHVNVIAIQNGTMTAWSVTAPDQRHTTVPLAATGTAQIYVIAQSATSYGPIGSPITITP